MKDVNEADALETSLVNARTMKIGCIGAGNMARVLGTLWAEKGHELFFGSRDLTKACLLADFVGHGAQAGSFAEAAQFGDVVLLAVHWEGVKNALELAGSLQGKILVDCNNAVDHQNFELAMGFSTSFAEEIAKVVPGAKVVKAFNTLFQEVFELEEAQRRSHQVTCFICGDDDEAKAVLACLADEIGFVPVDVGALNKARLVEPMANLIIYLGWVRGFGSNVAINVQKLPKPQFEHLSGWQEDDRLSQ